MRKLWYIFCEMQSFNTQNLKAIKTFRRLIKKIKINSWYHSRNKYFLLLMAFILYINTAPCFMIFVRKDFIGRLMEHLHQRCSCCILGKCHYVVHRIFVGVILYYSFKCFHAHFLKVVYSKMHYINSIMTLQLLWPLV